MHKLLKYILVMLLLVAGAGRLCAQYDKDVFFMRGRRALADGKYSLAIENFNVLSQLDTADYWTFFSVVLQSIISVTFVVQRGILTARSV